MSAYPIDSKAELFAGLSKMQRLRHLPLAEEIAASLELLANTLGFEIAILGKIDGEEWQAKAIHGTSSLAVGASFPLAELPCYVTANSDSACYQEKTRSSDAAFNYAVYLGRALIVDNVLYGTVHLGRKSALPRSLLNEEEEFFLLVADSLSAALERQAAREREEYLRNQNQALNAAQKAIHMGYWYWDVKTNKTEWSEELFRVYGLEPFSVDTTYQEWLNVVAPEDRERCNQIVWAASQTGTSFEMDWDTLHQKTGVRRHLVSVGDCIKDAAGNVTAMFGTAQDITEKKRAQDLIRKSEQALTAAQAAAKLGHWRWDLATNIVEWSDEYYRLHGYEPRSIEPNYELWRATIAPNDLERMVTVLNTAMETKTGYEVEYDIVLPTGERRSQYSLTRVVLDEKGNVSYLFGIGQDITERKKAEEKLRRSELSLKASQKFAKLGHWRWVIVTNEVEISEEQYRNLGYEPYSVPASYALWFDRIAPEFREEVQARKDKSLEDAQPYEIEYEIILPSGERRTIYEFDSPELDANGKLIAFFGICQDITERKKAEEKLRRSEEALKRSNLALETAQKRVHLGYWYWDIKTNKTEWSEELFRVYGLEPFSVDTTYEEWMKVIIPEQRELAQQVTLQAVNSGGSMFLDWTTIHGRHLNTVGDAIKDEDGNVIAMFGTSQDITERKAMENVLRDRTRDLELAMEVSKQISQILTTEELLDHLVMLLQKSFNLYHVSVFIYDEEQDALVLQDASGEIGKRLKQEGKQFSLSSNERGLVLQAARTRQATLVNDVSKSNNHLANLYLPLTQSELAMPMLVGTRLVGVLDLQSSQVDHFTATELRVLSSLAEQLAIAIENARLYSQQARVTQKLIQLDKLKSQFLANMSHELRTPLNAILNFSSFVAKGVYGEVNAEQEENLNKVIGSATHLLALINDILDLSKIEAGMMHLFIEDANMNSLFQSVINTASGLARPKSVSFVFDLAPNLPTMKLDKRRVRQIFLNLLSNAFKFTQSGEVKMKVIHEDNMLICSVSDTGTGIPASELELIFEPFKQTDIGVSKGGTGLGLPISRYFAEAHGGKLWVESEFGKGATFYVSLPTQVDIIREN